MLKNVQSYLERYQLSGIGISLGLVLFSVSMTPSLIPRSDVIQGVLGGILMGIGYLITRILIGVWRILELPEFASSYRRTATGIVFLVCLVIFVLALLNLRDSQNDLRALMTMSPLEGNHEFIVVCLAMMLFLFLLLLGRLVITTVRFMRSRMPRRMPPRVSTTLSLLLVAILSWNLGNGIIARGLLNSADEALREIDSIIDPELPVPQDSNRSGSSASLIPWRSLGAQGRNFISGGYSAEEISEITGAPAKEPLRIYAGLNSARGIKERAELVLEEMKRVEAFERKILVVSTPTGTGWIDPAAIDPLEIMHGGDTAIVSMQYSYLMSPLALYIEPDLPPESANALVKAVHEHWRKLPPTTRPKLYLQGLSLGSYGSEHALSPLSMIDNPINGALWSGPTFGNPMWQYLTRTRNPDSPAWLPLIGDGRTVRFTTQENALDIPGSSWSQMRIIFLQYASDPITFFEPASAFRPPEWMADERAFDVLENLRWYPLVSMLQMAVDMIVSDNVPQGFGHVFAAEHYINAWVTLTDPMDWGIEDTDSLKQLFR